MSDKTTVVDFVAKDNRQDRWKMVLVEEGPWLNSVEDQLRRIQDRLYGCLDAALDGELARRFPESTGKSIVVQLDCYNLPTEEVSEFFRRFSNNVFATGDYFESLRNNEFVRTIDFEINFDNID